MQLSSRTSWLSTGSVQTFTAPVSGWYRCELQAGWGSSGGKPGRPNRPGAHVTGEIYLTKGQIIGIMVGGGGIGARGSEAWNGGGASISDGAGAGGGGRTDLRTSFGSGIDWQTGYTTDILTAGASGGYNKAGGGGHPGMVFVPDDTTGLAGIYAEETGGGGHRGGKKLGYGGSSYYDPNTNRCRNAYAYVPAQNDKTWETNDVHIYYIE